jgi:hypothetical protein
MRQIIQLIERKKKNQQKRRDLCVGQKCKHQLSGKENYSLEILRFWCTFLSHGTLIKNIYEGNLMCTKIWGWNSHGKFCKLTYKSKIFEIFCWWKKWLSLLWKQNIPNV